MLTATADDADPSRPYRLACATTDAPPSSYDEDGGSMGAASLKVPQQVALLRAGVRS